MFTALFVSTVLSQATPVPTTNEFKFVPTIDTTIYSFKSSDTLVEVTPTIVLPDVLHEISITVSLPIYTQSESTGVSDLALNADTSVWNGSLFGGKSTWSLNAGVLIPLASNIYTSTSLVPTLGTSLDVSWDKFSIVQSAEWVVVANGSSYNSLLNSQVSSQWFSGETNLNYELSDALTVGVRVTEQWITTGEWTVLAGPEVSWEPATNWAVSAGVGIPVYQNTTEELNTVVHFGVSFKF